MADSRAREQPSFTEDDELLWHQLDLMRRILSSTCEVAKGQRLDAGDRLPSREWGLPTNFEPYPWQRAAIDAWERNGRTGVVKVVTGAGKTALALMCLDQLLREDDAVIASVVVPTRVLLDQWYRELTDTLGLPATWIGRRSGEYGDRFSDGRRVMIYVLNSARVALGRPLSPELLEAGHFLIVDECHRAGAPENRRIFEVPRRFALGLSATPERDLEDAGAGKPDEGVPDVIGRELGPVVYELTFQEALGQAIVPPFELIHVAVDLTPGERRQYDKLTRELSDLRARIRQAPAYVKGRTRVANEFQLIKSLSRSKKSKIGKLAARYEVLTNKRKELLYRARNRRRCFESILEEERDNGDVRIMAFHERISEMNLLFERLVRNGMPVVADHTGLTETQRERSLDLYLRGVAPVLLSVKALIEGVNAPATDVGVIVAASASPRQKIQSLGRVMRKYPGKDTSRIYNVYVSDSADEHIFRRMDFEQMLGMGSVEYRKWLGRGVWETLDGPPSVPLPRDDQLDEQQLGVGQAYPGEDAGLELSLDTQGNVYRDLWERGSARREFLSVPTDVLEATRKIRDGGGPIRITDRRRYVLVPSRNADGEWDVFYAGRLHEPLQWRERPDERLPLKLSARHGGSVVVGRKYDFGSPAARKLLALVRDFEKEQGVRIHKVELAPQGGAFVRNRGREYEVGRLTAEDRWPLGKNSYTELRKELSDVS